MKPEDGRCLECGRSLAIFGRPGYEERGYCDRSCAHSRTGVGDLAELALMLGCNAGVESISRFVYKTTECGASFNAQDDGVEVAGYVEGWQGECELHELKYPFHIDDFWTALNEADVEAGEIWDTLHPSAVEQLQEAIEDGNGRVEGLSQRPSVAPVLLSSGPGPGQADDP